MVQDVLSRPASGARSTRAVVALCAVVLSLVACSADGPSGTDSVVAVEQAQDEAAAELAEVQAALDRQVEAADAQQAQTRAAADQVAAEKAAADRAAAEKAAAEKAAAEKAAADRAAARKPAARSVAAPAAAEAVTRPQQRTPPRTTKAVPARTGAGKVHTPAVPAPRPVPPRPARAAAVPEPAVPVTRPAAEKAAVLPPVGLAPRAVASPTDLTIVVAPGATMSIPGSESVATGCAVHGFSAGDRVRLTTVAGATVRETVLPACSREVVPAPGTGVATTAPRLRVALEQVPWRAADTWVLHIGAHRWPVTASALSGYAWSITVTADGGVTAGPVG